MEEKNDENSDNESYSSSSSDSISAKAEEELEIPGVYEMILFTDVSKGVSARLDNLSQEDALIIARTEGELEARYGVDESFADQLMQDKSFIQAIKSMHEEGSKYDKKRQTTYVLCLHSAFKNRYRYLCALSVWAKRRWLYLELKSEREGLKSFFIKQCDRFVRSIPPVTAFRRWTMNIEDIKKDFDQTIAKVAPTSMEQDEAVCG